MKGSDRVRRNVFHRRSTAYMLCDIFSRLERSRIPDVNGTRVQCHYQIPDSVDWSNEHLSRHVPCSSLDAHGERDSLVVTCLTIS